MSLRSVTAEDLKKFQWVGAPTLSPDGRWVVYEQTETDEQEDGYCTHLFLSSSDGEQRRQLTFAGHHNTKATWSPDGQSLAFISDRVAGSQVWMLPMFGGEPRLITRFFYGVSHLLWFPDGKTLLVVAGAVRNGDIEAFPMDMAEKEMNEHIQKMAKDWTDQPKRYDWLYHKRDGAGLSKGLVEQLVTMDVQTGAYRQLTWGVQDLGYPAVSPDGQHVAFSSNRRPNFELELHGDIYRVPTAGGPLELLCDDTMGETLSYSPDGRYLAFFGNRDEYRSATHTHLYLIPATGGTGVCLSKDFPDTLGNQCLTDMRMETRIPTPLWSRDGRYVYVLSTREARCEVVRFTLDPEDPLRTAKAEVVVGGNRDIYSLSSNGDRRLAIAYATFTHPGQVAVVDVPEGPGQMRHFRSVTDPIEIRRKPLFPAGEVRLDDSNQVLLQEIEVAVPEAFTYLSADGWWMQGFVVKPKGFPGKQKFPVILEVHGGPQMTFSYSYFHEIQWFAAQGYAVVFTNPRGSMGYGQEFANGVRLHYGEKDAQDVLNGLDAALQKFDFLDGARVALTGGSYGGFMTNWLVGQTKRFFAAVSQRSISNWISFYGVSDIGPLFVESQLGGDVVHDFERLWEMSPLAHIDTIETPLLLVHSEQDLRCPIEQAEQMYTALKRLGREVQLLRIPNASHGLSRNGKPSLRLTRLHGIFEYIDERLPVD